MDGCIFEGAVQPGQRGQPRGKTQGNLLQLCNRLSRQQTARLSPQPNRNDLHRAEGSRRCRDTLLNVIPDRRLRGHCDIIAHQGRWAASSEKRKLGTAVTLSPSFILGDKIFFRYPVGHAFTSPELKTRWQSFQQFSSWYIVHGTWQCISAMLKLLHPSNLGITWTL